MSAARPEEIFPTLTPTQIARLAPFGRERELADGEVLWEQGASHIPFYVILAGAIEVLAEADQRPVAVHRPGGFSGDVDLLSGRRMVVQGRARGPTRVLGI